MRAIAAITLRIVAGKLPGRVGPKRVLLPAMVAVAKAAGKADQPNKVIYHINGGLEQATDGLRNIRNHLDVDPAAKITVVTHALGVDFLLEGQKDVNGSLFAGPVSALAARGAFERVAHRSQGEVVANAIPLHLSATPDVRAPRRALASRRRRGT